MFCILVLSIPQVSFFADRLKKTTQQHNGASRSRNLSFFLAMARNLPISDQIHTIATFIPLRFFFYVFFCLIHLEYLLTVTFSLHWFFCCWCFFSNVLNTLPKLPSYHTKKKHGVAFRNLFHTTQFFGKKRS